MSHPTPQDEYVQFEEELDRVNDKLLALRSAVKRCRAAQKAYFKNRSKENLVAAKQAEAVLDKLVVP